MDEFICSCCCEPIHVDAGYWLPDVQTPVDVYAVDSFVDAAYVEPVYVEPAYVEPVYVEPVYVEPVYVEPAYVEPVYVEPAYVEPAYVEPVYVEPVYVEPAYVAPVSIAPLTAEIGGWEPAFTVIPANAVAMPATVLANVPTVVTGYDPGSISLAEALGSPSFGGNPWDTSAITAMQALSQFFIQNTVARPISIGWPAGSPYGDVTVNAATVANQTALMNN